MCNKTIIISKTKSGELSICKNCNSCHFIFNNIYFELNLKELKHLKEYLFKINIKKWETKHSCARLSRKTPIPTLQENLVLMFNSREITELKQLLSSKINSDIKMVNLDDIDYQLILN